MIEPSFLVKEEVTLIFRKLVSLINNNCPKFIITEEDILNENGGQR